MTSATALYRKEIVFDRETRDYAMYLDGELTGFAKTYHQAEVDLDQLVFDLLHSGLMSTASALDGGDPEHVTPIDPSPTKTFSVCPEASKPTINVCDGTTIETFTFRNKKQADKKIMALISAGYTFDAQRPSPTCGGDDGPCVDCRPVEPADDEPTKPTNRSCERCGSPWAEKHELVIQTDNGERSPVTFHLCGPCYRDGEQLEPIVDVDTFLAGLYQGQQGAADWAKPSRWSCPDCARLDHMCSACVQAAKGGTLASPICTAHGCTHPTTRPGLIPGLPMCDECDAAGMERLHKKIFERDTELGGGLPEGEALDNSPTQEELRERAIADEAPDGCTECGDAGCPCCDPELAAETPPRLSLCGAAVWPASADEPPADEPSVDDLLDRIGEAIRIGALALLATGIDFCTICGRAHRPTQCPTMSGKTIYVCSSCDDLTLSPGLCPACQESGEIDLATSPMDAMNAVPA